MANSTFDVPTLGSMSTKATAYGSVSGDVTTITEIKLETTNWTFGIDPSEFPDVTIIDNQQYTWTITETGTGMSGNEYVKKATLNIPSPLVINKPFVTIKYGADPTTDPQSCVRSFYDLGSLSTWAWDPGASDIEITGSQSVPINIEATSDTVVVGSIVLSADATYRFTWTLGSMTYSITRTIASGTTRIETSYTIPRSWNEALPEATSGTMRLTIESIFGSQVYQTISTTIRATVPADCLPVINSVTLADRAGRVPASWAMFVQDQSNVALSEVAVTTSYGSDIQAVHMEVDGTTYSGTMASLPASAVFETYGVISVTVTVEDGRGRTAARTAQITVVQYDPPTLSVDSMRCGSTGEIENEGEYFLAMTSTSHSSCNNKNSATLTVAYKLTSASSYGSAAQLSTGESMTAVCGGDLDTEYSYDVKYVLTDQFNTVTVIDFVSTAVYLMHFLHGGRGVAFGSKATRENCADFAFDAIFRGAVEFEKSNGETVTIAQIIDALGL